MGREVELKLELDPKDAPALAGDDLLRDAEPRCERLVSVYYDTRRGKLRKNGFLLRVRSSPEGYVQTVKSIEGWAGLDVRDEWERPVQSLEPQVDVLARTPAGEVGAKRLHAIASSTVDRTLWRVKNHDSELEISLDDGDVRADGRDQPLCELEIELKSGKADAAFHAARKIAHHIPLRLGVMSKAERGFALADHLLGRVAKAQPVPVRPDMTIAEGFAQIVHSCIRHFRLNEPLVVRDQNPEALHQARVAMRRLRSALSLFRPAVRDRDFDRIRDELRWFTSQLGHARNLDVYLDSDLPKQERKGLLKQRADAYRMVTEAMDSRRIQLLMIDLVAWLAVGEWRSSKKAGRPLTAFAERRISQLWLDITAHGDLRGMADEERHRLRIEIKKLRYALDSLQGLYTSAARRQRQFTSAIEALQEALGHLNDIATARRFGAEPEPEPRSEGRASEEELKSIREALKCFNRLKLIGPYWIGCPAIAAT